MLLDWIPDLHAGLFQAGSDMTQLGLCQLNDCWWQRKLLEAKVIWIACRNLHANLVRIRSPCQNTAYQELPRKGVCVKTNRKTSCPVFSCRLYQKGSHDLLANLSTSFFKKNAWKTTTDMIKHVRNLREPLRLSSVDKLRGLCILPGQAVFQRAALSLGQDAVARFL